MIRLHPLEVRALDSLRYVFKFRGESGELEFPFEFHKETTCGMYNLKFGTDDFIKLTKDDPCDYLVDWCLQHFHRSRDICVNFRGQKCKALMYRFCGEPEPDSYKYIVTLQSDTQVFNEQILVDYRTDDAWFISSSQGRAKIYFDRMSRLELVEPRPENADLLQSILYFDELRYFRTCKEDVPFKTGVDYGEQF